MEEFGLWRDEWHARLRVLAADLSKPFLGRGFAGYSELAALPVDTVFHCAAWVNWLLPVDALRPANVDGTARILLLCADFMRRGQSLRFVLVSTLSVLHRGPEAALETAPMAPEQAASDLRSGYAQSKWLAEALLHHAARAGEAQLFEARVVRLGMVTGHSQSGACDAAQFVPRFLLSCTRRQAVLRDPLVDNERFEMLPVDTAARMVALLGLAPRVGAQRPGDIAVYHVASPPELCPSYAELASWIRDAAPMLQWREEQLERWAATVLADKEDPLYPLAAFVASPHAFRTGTRISCANALRDLSALKQALFHPISSEIVAASVRFLLNREAESRASRSLLTSDMSEGTQHQGAAGLQVTVSPPSAEQALPRATHVVRLPWTRRADDERDDESKGSQSDDNDAEGRDGPLPSSQIGGPLPRTARRRPREEFFLETDAEGRLLPPVNNPDLPRRLSRDHSFMLPAETKDGQNDRLGATTERK
jgi:thioester reductase-like protein